MMAGHPLNLSCLAEGNPRPIIGWSLRRETGQSEGRGHNNQLIFPAVSPADAGFYVCEATNMKGTQSADVELLVHGERNSGLWVVLAPPRASTFTCCTSLCIHSSAHQRLPVSEPR